MKNLSQKVEILSNPNSELCPVAELKLVEDNLKKKESEFELLSANLNESNEEIEKLKKTISDLQSSIRKYQNQIEEINHTNEKIRNEKDHSNDDFQQFINLTKAVHNCFLQSGRILHNKKIGEKLNSLFMFAKLNSIAFYDPQLTFNRCQSKISIQPTLPMKVERIKSTIQNIKESLTCFPNETHFTDSKEIEDDLIQIANCIISLKDVFDDQKAHIDEVNQVLSSQHKTIIQISDSEKATIGNQSDN